MTNLNSRDELNMKMAVNKKHDAVFDGLNIPKININAFSMWQFHWFIIKSLDTSCFHPSIL